MSKLTEEVARRYQVRRRDRYNSKEWAKEKAARERTRRELGGARTAIEWGMAIDSRTGLCDLPTRSPFLFAAMGRPLPGLVTRMETIPYPSDILTRQVFGEPGAGLDTSGFDEAAIAAGKEGERRTAAILAAFASQYPTVRVYHGLPWPGSKGDVDHALLMGKHVMFIDSKMWAAGVYSVDGDEQLLRDGAPFAGSRLKLEMAMEAWVRVLPRTRHTLSWLVVAYISGGTHTPVSAVVDGVPVVDESILREYLAGLGPTHATQPLDPYLTRLLYESMVRTGRLPLEHVPDPWELRQRRRTIRVQEKAMGRAFRR
jgi:hypothetical protein